MRNSLIAIILFLIILFLSPDPICGQRLQNRPPMERAQRIEIAKQVLAGVYGDFDPTKPEQRETEYRVLIDPIETFEFILANPTPDDGIGWDHNAMMYLMNNPNLVTDDQIIQLLELQKYELFWNIYVQRLSKNIDPRERAELHDRLRVLFQTRQFDSDQNAGSILTRIIIAKNLGMTELEARFEEELREYFSSGKAAIEYDSIEDDPNFPDNGIASRFFFRVNAPDSFKQKFAKVILPASQLQQLLVHPNLTDEEKLIEMKQSLQGSLGQWSHHYLPLASSFGEIAKLDLPLAENTLDRLEDGARCWARINIAIAIFNDQPETAKQQLRLAYRELEDSSQLGDNHERAYNYPLALIGAAGLHAVEVVDPEMMRTAVKIVAEMAPELLRSDLGNARSNYFNVTAAVARYDRQTAITLLQNGENQVSLHSAASYFAALTALEPERILDEYQEIPQQPDSWGISYRPYIRNAIIPALCANDDEEFWDKLNPPGLRIQVPHKE